MSATWNRAEVRKFVSRMLLGVVVGAGSAALFIGFGRRYLPLDDLAGTAAATFGLVYVVIAVSLLLGLAAPRAGAHFLNVEDAEEIRDHRPMLGYSGASMALCGVLLLIAAMAEALLAGGVSRAALAIAAGSCLIGAIVLGVRSAAFQDELMRQVSYEACALTLYATMLIYGAWAVLAQIGLVEWMSPLALLASLAIIQLLAAFWVVGRRGMLKPR
jgi:hypothetical protein